MKVDTKVTVKNNLRAYATGLVPTLDQVVRKTAFDVAGGAQVRSRVDFGAMKAGWYAKTNRTSTYGDAVSEAQAANPDVAIMSEVAAPGSLEAFVANVVGYAADNELGTVNMEAHPMLHPSADEHRPGFEAAVAAVLKRG